MFAYLWPMALIVICNTVYQICAKATPDISPFASLTVTYAVAALASALLFVMLDRSGESLIQHYGKLNWAPFVLGIVIIGLEAGWIFAYKAGWQVSTAFITQSAVLALFLIIVGTALYGEKITLNKLVGVVVCLAGLFIINRS